MIFIRQSTATTVILGPFVDGIDGSTTETGLSIPKTAIRLSKNGSAFNYANDTTLVDHTENGCYSVALDATDSDTPGVIVVVVDVAGARPVRQDLHVLPPNVYDSLFSTDKLQVDMTQMNGTSTTDGGYDFIQTMRLMFSVLCGKVSVTTSTNTFRAVGDTQDRLVVTVDGDGQRTGITYTAT